MRAALCFFFLSLPLHAQDIQRCESHGQVSYTERGCPPDSAARSLRRVPLDAETERAAQARLAQQKKQLAQQQAQQEQSQAREAARAQRQLQIRQHKEAEAAARLHKKCQASQQKLQWLREDLAQATGKTHEKQAIRLRRAEQLHAQLCKT